jgi:hypothetical protein
MEFYEAFLDCAEYSWWHSQFTNKRPPTSVSALSNSVLGNGSAPLANECSVPSCLLLRVGRVIVPPNEEEGQNEYGDKKQTEESQRSGRYARCIRRDGVNPSSSLRGPRGG